MSVRWCTGSLQNGDRAELANFGLEWSEGKWASLGALKGCDLQVVDFRETMSKSLGCL